MRIARDQSYPVADRAHGAVLRSPRNRAYRGGFRAAIIHRLKPHLVRSTFDSCRADAIERHSAEGPTPDVPPVCLHGKGVRCSHIELPMAL
jgi:hypothetical protein